MRLISRERVRKFLSDLEDIFHEFHIKNDIWLMVDKRIELHFGKNIKDEWFEKAAHKIEKNWTEEDILTIRPDLSAKQAEFILERINKNHEENIVINKELTQLIANHFFPVDFTKIN
jgi:hypothetical protein